MNKNGKRALKLLAVAGTLLVGASAFAQSAKQYSVALGFREIKFKVQSGFLTAPTPPGVQNDIKPDTQPNVTINYMLTDNIGHIFLAMTELLDASAILGITHIFFHAFECFVPMSFVSLNLSQYFADKTGPCRINFLCSVHHY